MATHCSYLESSFVGVDWAELSAKSAAAVLNHTEESIVALIARLARRLSGADEHPNHRHALEEDEQEAPQEHA